MNDTLHQNQWRHFSISSSVANSASQSLLTDNEQMRQKGVVVWGEKMLVKKGPNWQEPKFVTEKKYGIQ
ncbi:hypothetical protein [Klebsiella michiganensis]|uniref:hypothetical protein n=1 Tax=Klebsiella michiganensis TaxID=1134687 RepID=UPI0015EA3884|nr:hypothetical protein [Klebsiella michiganensis]QMR53421.1 hypothetical protein HV264_00240 [Klebsiella michiganensis]